MKTFTLSIALGGIVAVLTGCSTATFNVEAMSGIKRVAVVSVSMSHLPGKEATESNHKVLKEVMVESADVLAQELETACDWKVLRVDDVRKSAAFQKTVTNLNSDSGYKLYKAYREKSWINPDGLSDIPRSYLYSKNQAAAVVAGRNALQQICADLDVDGVIVLYVATFIGNETGFRFSGGARRTYGYIKFNPIMSMMDKNGVAVFSVGSTNLDDLAPTKHRVPIYKGAPTSSYQLDLDHEHVRKAFQYLEKKTLKKLAIKVKRNLPK